MKDLIIVGGGQHACEVAEIVERINQVQPTWNLLGFIAGPKAAQQIADLHNGLRILGPFADIDKFPNAMLATPFEARNHRDLPLERLATIVDPSVFVSRTATIGAGCVIYPGCFVGFKAVLGNRVFVLSGSTINHDCRIDDFAVLCSGAQLAGTVHVEEDCYLGQACTVRQMLRIGRRSMIGMGAVIIRDVPPNSVMVGNPARKLRDRDAAT